MNWVLPTLGSPTSTTLNFKIWKKSNLLNQKKGISFRFSNVFLMPVLEKAKIQFLIPPFSFYTIYLSLLIYPIRNTPTECIFSIAGSIIFLCCKNMSINFDISEKVLNGVNIYMYKPRFSETLFCMFLFDFFFDFVWLLYMVSGFG